MRHIVFDLDNTLEYPCISADKLEFYSSEYEKRWHAKPSVYTWTEVSRRWGAEEPDISTHQFLPYLGTIELLRWVHAKGMTIDFFSSACQERNEALCQQMMHEAFPKDDVPYRVFSTWLHSPKDSQENHNGYLGGRMKKKLEDVVFPSEEMPDVLLIEDDRSYSAKGEEENLVYLNCLGDEFLEYMKKKANHKKMSRAWDISCSLQMYHRFYYAGILNRILMISNEKGIALRDAAKQAQYTDNGIQFPIGEGEDRPSQPFTDDKNFKCYQEGLALLKEFNPNLDFWYGIEKIWGK